MKLVGNLFHRADGLLRVFKKYHRVWPRSARAVDVIAMLEGALRKPLTYQMPSMKHSLRLLHIQIIILI